jgi:tetratricopeptide (TPR) repeat protein
VLLAFVAGRCLVPMDETDLFYNLRLGEIILETHHVPRTNLLSFTHPDFPDPNLAWLFQLGLALAHRAAGIPGTVLLKTALVLGTFALLFRVALWRRAHPALAAASLALAAFAAEPRFVERPHLVTFLGIATLLLALERAEAGRPRLLVAMVFLGLGWANGNSCFFLAPAILLLYAAGAFADGLAGAGRRALLVGGAMLPLLFATPSGTGWLGYVANHFRMPFLRPLQEYRVAEWPLDGAFFLLLGAAVLACLPGLPGRPVVVEVARPEVERPRRRAVPLRQALPMFALAALGARRIRFVAEFSLLAGPFVAARLTAGLAEAHARWAATRWSAATGTRIAQFASAVLLAGLVAVTVGPRLAAVTAGRPWLDLSIEDGLVPFEAIGWLDAHGLRDRLYNDLEVGSYLTWQGWPEHRVFQDPRINAYPESFHAALRRADLPRARWQALLDGFAVEAALVTFPTQNPRAALFDPRRWALCYRSAEALVFVRRTAAHASLIAREELPLTFAYQADGPAPGVATLVLELPPPDADGPVAGPRVWSGRVAEQRIELLDPSAAERAFRKALDSPPGAVPALAELPPELLARFRAEAGALALRQGQLDRAIALLDGLADPAARTNLGFAQLERTTPPGPSPIASTRAAEQALATFRAVLGAGPDNPEAAFGEGLALATLGRTEEAIARLRAFVERWPNHLASPHARRMLNRLSALRAP